MSAAAIRMYGAIAHQEWQTVDETETEFPGTVDELKMWRLIDTTGKRPVVLDPKTALKRKLREDLAAATEVMARMDTLPGLSEELFGDFKAAQLRVPGGNSVFLADQAEVNARIQEVVSGARREILASQPGGPRSRELLQIAVSRDTAALDRGVELRTIYRAVVRDHHVTAEYARTMSARTEGRPAQYRTLEGDFVRMIIVDREAAFVPDYIVEGSPAHSAWLVTNPAVVAVLAQVYEVMWRRAQPWTGDLRPARGRLAEAVEGPDGVRTTRREREIMRMLCAGVSQKKIAATVGISQRKLEENIACLKALWGVHTLNELIYGYALSLDRLVDDSAPGDGLTVTDSAA